MLKQHRKNLSLLRRRDVFDNVRGGCVSVEVTNETKGWHLHAHWLVDARWVDAPALARTWGELVGQDYAIVKVMDVRGKLGYQHELTKYCVKGNELAKWDAEKIHQFVTAIRGNRFFFVFGELFKLQSKIRALLNQETPEAVCDCGHCSFMWETETQAILNQVRREK